MKPSHIILVRHGESEGNVDKNLYLQKPDYAYDLTEKGKQQARACGIELAAKYGGPAAFYVSPYWRTRRTYEGISQSIKAVKHYEDPRIREQEWGTNFHPKTDNLENERDTFGHFYFRIPNGESCADVYDRVSDFLGTLWRDFEKYDYPTVSIIVTHGMTIRLFLMRFFHWTVEQFEIVANPANCGYYVLELDGPRNHHPCKYNLITELKKYPKYNHPYQYK